MKGVSEMTSDLVEKVRRHYSLRRNVIYRIKLATEGATGRLITHNFKRIVGLLSPYNKGEKVVDIGCGWGYLLSFLPSYVDVYAFDLSREMLEISRAFRGKANRVIVDAQCIGARDNYFDKFFCLGLVGHIPRVNDALREIYRILKPNGRGVINFTNKFGLMNIPYTILRLKVGYYFKYNTLAPLDESFTYWEAKEALEDAGFLVERSYGWGFSVPYSIGKRFPNFSDRITECIIRVKDSWIIKHMSNAHVFLVRKP